MSEETKRIEQDVTEDGADYIEAIKQMRENTVDKAQYLKLKEENKRLLTSLVNGESLSPDEVPEPVDVKKLRAELYGSDNDYSNLEFITKTLQLRDAIIEQGGTDPFLPYGKNIQPTNEDIVTAEKVASVLRDCIEYADGDSAVFTNELQRKMLDMPARR